MNREVIQNNLTKLLHARPHFRDTLIRLNEGNIRYGICSGVHVEVLTNARTSDDVDILIHADDYEKTCEAFPEAKQKYVGNGILLVLGDDEDVELMGFADFFIEDAMYTFRLTDAALEKLQVFDCDEVRVPLVDPVDTVLLKAILQRGEDEGKRDCTDIKAITQMVDVDISYLQKRIHESSSQPNRIVHFLATLGIIL